MRICVDFKYLNSQLNVEKYPLPRFEEILTIVGNNKIFCKLDLNQAYLQMLVNSDDQNLLVFLLKEIFLNLSVCLLYLLQRPVFFRDF